MSNKTENYSQKQVKILIEVFTPITDYEVQKQAIAELAKTPEFSTHTGRQIQGKLVWMSRNGFDESIYIKKEYVPKTDKTIRKHDIIESICSSLIASGHLASESVSIMDSLESSTKQALNVILSAVSGKSE